ncbi:tetratricopeptide repeat-containing sensor histidine kinase [Ferruginibacter sp. SUN106]|uniref:tetratricopeptide repeat-containing sensor histidine kinase n=1 Tax=Ferruginibacter sp. SUN106 TaxID=2978348 RepID=UPI003D36D518
MRKIILFIICLIPFAGIAQNNVFDSIRNRIKTQPNDTEKVRLLVQLGNKIKYKDTVEAWQCQKRIDSFSVAKKNDFFKAQSYFLAATIQLANQTQPSIDNYEKAIKIFSKYPDNLRSRVSMGTSYINLGLLHANNADYETATFYYLKAEEIYLKDNPNNSDLGVLYSNLSIAYGTINRWDEGIRYSEKGLAFARRNNDKANLLNAWYAYGGSLVNAKRDAERGLLILDSAKQIAVEMNNLNMIYSCDFMSAMYYYNTKQYQKAIDYYTLCLDFARKYNFTAGIGNNFLNISANEAELKRPKLAAAHLDSSAKYLDYSQITSSKQMYFENYAEVYKQLGNFTKAFAYKDSVGVIKDSLYQADNIRQMEFRQARYNYEKKQSEVNELEAEKKIQELSIRQKNILNYILIGSAITILLLSLLAYRNYKQKQKLQQQRIAELETQQQLTATEAVLKGEEQERTRLAKDLHDGLGGMLSGIKYSFNTMKGNLVMTPENSQAFERSMDMLDSSIKEMRRVAHNMMPEALVKFGLDTALKDFCADINQSGALKINYQSIGVENADIDQTTAITIYRIVQELINNTLKHAAATTAIVQVTKSDGQLSVTVEDDGKGFDAAILQGARGIGWSNIQSRVDFLKGKLDINSQEGKGTSVLIELTV